MCEGFTTFVDSIYTPPHDRTTYSQKMTKKIYRFSQEIKIQEKSHSIL